MGVLTAIGATVASVAAGAMSANSKAKAAKKAAAAQVQAANDANAVQERVYNDQKRLLTPGALAGADANAKRQLLTGSSTDAVNRYLNDTYGAYGATGAPQYDSFNTEDYLKSTPGYQFRFDEGQRGLERSAAARGQLFSGATGRELTRYGQGFASNEFDKAWGRLSDLAGEGASNTGNIVVQAGNYGDAVSGNIIGAGNARKSGYNAAGDAWGSFWGDTVPGAIGQVQGTVRKNPNPSQWGW